MKKMLVCVDVWAHVCIHMAARDCVWIIFPKQSLLYLRQGFSMNLELASEPQEPSYQCLLRTRIESVHCYTWLFIEVWGSELRISCTLLTRPSPQFLWWKPINELGVEDKELQKTFNQHYLPIVSRWTMASKWGLSKSVPLHRSHWQHTGNPVQCIW